jgi:hypothetical protein
MKQETMTVQEYRELIAKQKKLKYHNQITYVDGITFDSKRESERYSELKFMQMAGLINQLELQPKFVLQEGFKKNGKAIKAITYKADFMYWDNELKQTVVEDVKGYKTQTFRLKQKMFEEKYPGLSLKLIT